MTTIAQVQADLAQAQHDLGALTTDVNAASAATAKLLSDLSVIATDLAGLLPPPPPPGTVGFAQPAMTAPAGYTSPPIFHDTFAGSALDLTKWWPRMGAGGPWDNNGNDKCPYTGANLPLNQNGQWEGQLMHPSQLVVNNGLTIHVVPNPTTAAPYNQYISLSGAMTSFSQSLGDCTGSTAQHGLPSTGWFAQILAKLPDAQHGCSGTFWFLGTGGGGEIDVIQSTFGVQQGASGAGLNFYPMACGPTSGGQQYPNVGVDCTLAFHKYGCEWIPGNPGSVKCYFDGKLVATFSGNYPAMNYEVIIHALTWTMGAAAQGWTTGYDPALKLSYAYEVAEVSVYAK